MLHALLLTIHHIVTDLWSLTLLFEELGALYQPAPEGRTAALPAPAHAYADSAIIVSKARSGYQRNQAAGKSGIRTGNLWGNTLEKRVWLPLNGWRYNTE